MSGINIGETLKPGSFADEKEHIKTLVGGLGYWQVLVIFGIAISGISAFMNTYDYVTSVNSQLATCVQSAALKEEINKEFIWLLVLSCLAVVLGSLAAWFLRKSNNQRSVFTFGFILTGIFGILYALSIKYQHIGSGIKMGLSWTSFLGFLVLGFFVSSGYKLTSPITVATYY